MIVFFINLSKPRTQILKPAHYNLFAIRHRYADTLSSRVRDPGIDKCMIILKKTRNIYRLKDLLFTEPNKTLSVSGLESLSFYRFSSEFMETGSLILKYPEVFEIYEHPIHRVLFCRFTRKALAHFEFESLVVLAQIPEAVICLRKLLMLSGNRRVLIDCVRINSSAFGLPDDFETSVILKHPEFFRLVGSYIECAEKERDRAVSVCEIEKFRERTYRANKADPKDTQFAFPVDFPPGFKMEGDSRVELENWQRLPYWSPYFDVSKHDMRSDEAWKRKEKRTVATIHELLSITVEKRLLLERIEHFRNTLDLPHNLVEFLLRHQGIFYISSKGDKGKIRMVFLREAYDREGKLVVPNGVYLARLKFAKLCRMTARNDDLDGELVRFVPD